MTASKRANAEHYRAAFQNSAGWPQDWQAALARARSEAERVLIVNEKDGTPLVLIPEGKFLAGDPPVSVYLPAFYVALHPVTWAQYARFCRETSREPPAPAIKHPSEQNRVTNREEPIGNVSWYNARAYCDWAGLRLPRQLEWEKAARGCHGRLSTRTEWRRHGSSHGAFASPGLASPWGCYRMGLRDWEWCDDHYSTFQGKPVVAGSQASGGISAIVRGGSILRQRWAGWRRLFYRMAPDCEPLVVLSDFTLVNRYALDAYEGQHRLSFRVARSC